MPNAELERLRELKAKREEARKAESEALEVEALQLEEKFEASGKKLGVDFLVVTTLIGNFVVSNPDFIVAKKFADAKEKSVVEVIQFVAPCVIAPDQMIARSAFQEHGGIAWKLATACMKLHEADATDRLGK